MATASRGTTTLWLSPDENLWLWRVEAVNRRDRDIECDAILIQDIGLGDRGFLMNNEAYASQYIDHHVGHTRVRAGNHEPAEPRAARHYPWVLHGCLDGAAGFATDGLQLFGPAFRDGDRFGFAFGANLPDARASSTRSPVPRSSRAANTCCRLGAAAWTLLWLFVPDHPEASSDGDPVACD